MDILLILEMTLFRGQNLNEKEVLRDKTYVFKSNSPLIRRGYLGQAP